MLKEEKDQEIFFAGSSVTDTMQIPLYIVYFVKEAHFSIEDVTSICLQTLDLLCK
jgi:hypothetical protein